MNEVKVKRTQRTVSIEQNVYERVCIMSERLGVNVNAYLLEAIGQKLYKDESLLRIEKASSEATLAGIQQMVELMEQATKKENPND
jgi:hypothetical protein